MTTTDLHPLLATILDAEGDYRFTLMAVYADYLEERGDRTAKGWRTMAELQRWPVMASWFMASEWGDIPSRSVESRRDELPDDVFEALTEDTGPSAGGRSKRQASYTHGELPALIDAAEAFSQEDLP